MTVEDLIHELKKLNKKTEIVIWKGYEYYPVIGLEKDGPKYIIK